VSFFRTRKSERSPDGSSGEAEELATVNTHRLGPVSKSKKGDIFPDTKKTMIGKWLDGGTTARRELNRHLMDMYHLPLMVYFKGLKSRAYHALGDAEDLVQGFFADRLGRNAYIQKWQESGIPLRRYLRNGFHFYLKERIREENRNNMAGALPEGEELEEDCAGPDDVFDRAVAQAYVQETLLRGEESSRANGLLDHWRVFLRHWFDGRSFPQIAEEFGIPSSRAGTMAATGRRRFEKLLRAVICEHLADKSNVDSEIRSLLDVIDP
jgi:DNA-directed RNA polymerase specialized sigma24 family protein